MDDYAFIGPLDIKQTDLFYGEESVEQITENLSITEKEIEILKERLINLKNQLSQKEEKRHHLIDKLKESSIKHQEIKLEEPKITKNAEPDTKAAFLLDLFYGRRDVYAVRRWNEKAGRAAYSPRCLNFWTDRCLLKRHKNEGGGEKPDCNKCDARMYEELTPNLVVIRQLKNPDSFGRNAIGVYPMLQGNMCRFVAIDLDELTWKDDSLIIADVARASGFQMAIEKSFSGNGAHLWLFFSEPIPASKARKLAFSFLNSACQKSKSINLKSFDRIFPSQDSIEEGGLGNLIMMPLLFGAARRKENPGTVFVDNSFEIYPDQIAFLSSLPRYTEKDIEMYLASSESFSFLAQPDFLGDGVDVLWQTKLPKLGKKDCTGDYLPVYLSAGISIPKNAMNAKMQNAIKRMASFSNPEYYKAIHRNHGFVSEEISSFVSTFIESDSVLQIPRGLYETLVSYLKKNLIEYKVYDKRIKQTGLDADFIGSLRKEQDEALNHLLCSENGILKAATSFGKTIVAAALIAARKEKTLILVHKQDLLDQWRNSLERFLVVNNQPVKRKRKRLNSTGIGIYANNRDSLSGYIDVATFQTVASRMPSFIRNYGMVIVDECHHVAADSFSKVMNCVTPKFVYGLSATVKRDDGLDNLVYSQCGKVVFEYSPDRLAYNRGIVQCLVPRFTSSSLTISNGKAFNHVESIKCLSSDDVRNNLITSDAKDLVNDNHKVLILTGLVEHACCLAKILQASDCSSIVLTGKLTKEEIKKAQERITNDEFDVIVATGKYLGEGTDIPSLDSLLIATPISWEGVVSQYAGRIAREYSGKKKTYIYDYVDVCIPQYARMYVKRLSTYRKLGYITGENIESLKDDKKNGLFPNKAFFTQFDILEAFVNSIRGAADRIVISCPQLFISRTTKAICEELCSAKKRKVEIEIRTVFADKAINAEAQAEGLKYLGNLGFSFNYSLNSHLRFAVIDSSEIWFGDINLLGGAIGKSYDSSTEQKVMLHTYNQQAAVSLLGSDFLI